MWARLAPEQREELLVRALVECQGYEALMEWLDGQGVATSVGALHSLLSSHGLRWRLERAHSTATASAESLPADADAAIVRALRQQTFAAAFGELSVQEVSMLRKLELEERKLGLQERQTDLTERRIALLERQASAAKELSEDEELTAEEKAARLREIFRMG